MAVAERVFRVRQYEGETTDEAFAAEHPGETVGPNDLVVVVVKMSGLTRAEAMTGNDRRPRP